MKSGRSIYKYGVVSTDGNHEYDDPIAALQHAAYMESVGSESVFYLCAEFDGETKRIKRITAYDMIKAIRGDSRGEAGSNDQQLLRSQRV